MTLPLQKQKLGTKTGRQAVEVYDLGTESEKDLLKPLLNQKRYNLLKRGRVSEVEEEQPQ